jgi:hypothetical protein
MGSFPFDRRRVGAFPGLSVNLSKYGSSLRVGVRGAHVTMRRRGVTRTVGIPGTGSTTRRGPAVTRTALSAGKQSRTWRLRSEPPARDSVTDGAYGARDRRVRCCWSAVLGR